MKSCYRRLRKLFHILGVFHPSEFVSRTKISICQQIESLTKGSLSIFRLEKLSLILNEAFRNAYDCGSESFRRVHIKIREIDSPFIAKVNDNDNANVGRATSSKELAQSGPRVELKSRKKLGFQTVETKPTVVEDWKNNKEKDITSQIADLQSELYAVEAQLEEMNRPIMEQPHSGRYKTIVCGNCHVRGHRSEGNKNNAPCLEEPSMLFLYTLWPEEKTSGTFRRNTYAYETL